MLKVMLAGLVMSKVLTLKQAEAVLVDLGSNKIPDTLEETVRDVEKAIRRAKSG